MRLIIVPTDTVVSIDGEAYSGISMASLPSNVHAIQWYGTNGEIEFNDGTFNQTITSVTPYLNFVTLHAAKKLEIKMANPPYPYSVWNPSTLEWDIDVAAKNAYDELQMTTAGEDIVEKIKKIQPTEAGLDADLLDGQHGSYYSPISSPAFTGTPTAPTAAIGTNTSQIATTTFVKNQLMASVAVQVMTNSGNIILVYTVAGSINITKNNGSQYSILLNIA